MLRCFRLDVELHEIEDLLDLSLDLTDLRLCLLPGLT